MHFIIVLHSNELQFLGGFNLLLFQYFRAFPTFQMQKQKQQGKQQEHSQTDERNDKK
jgi:hypothetical protein